MSEFSYDMNHHLSNWFWSIFDGGWSRVICVPLAPIVLLWRVSWNGILSSRNHRVSQRRCGEQQENHCWRSLESGVVSNVRYNTDLSRDNLTRDIHNSHKIKFSFYSGSQIRICNEHTENLKQLWRWWWRRKCLLWMRTD